MPIQSWIGLRFKREPNDPTLVTDKTDWETVSDVSGLPVEQLIGQTRPYFNSAVTNSLVGVSTGPKNNRILYVTVVNPNTADVWLQMFDIAGGKVNITLGTTPPTRSIFVPGGSGSNSGAVTLIFPVPITVWNELTIAGTTTATGSAAPSSNLTVEMEVD